MLVQMTEEVHAERAVPTGHEAEASLEELLAFERLLFDLSACFANVADGKSSRKSKAR